MGNLAYWIIGLLIFIILCLYFSIRSKSKIIEQNADAHRAELQKIAKKLSSFDSDLRATFGEDYIYKISGTPTGSYLDDDFLPVCPTFPNEPWGKYTMYVSRSKYHTPSCRYAVGALAKNALEVSLHRNYYASCKVCFSSIPDVSWAIKSRSYISFIMEYAPDSITAKEAQVRNEKRNTYHEKSNAATWNKLLSRYK